MAMEPIPQQMPGEPPKPPESFLKLSPSSITAEQFIKAWALRGFFPSHLAVTFGAEREPHFSDSIKFKILGTLKKGSINALIGGRGTGKTQIACDLLQAYPLDSVIEKRPRYTTASALFREIRSAYSSKTSEKELFAGYIKPTLLVVDEAQVRGETDFEDRTLTEIVDARYGAMVDTILIANLQRDALAKSLGASIVSRIHERGDVIECNWPSFREKKP